VVLPDGSLFGEGVKTRIKEELMAKCNLHTIVRLPNGVFSPYTNIKTNLLFFDKGMKTNEIWYYELPYPDGIKNFNKTRPINIKDFEDLKKWWTNRAENEYAWKVTAEDIKAKDYNLDSKNPHVADENLLSAEELLAKYQAINNQIQTLQKSIAQTLSETF
jgi:type I restriction enzyme M protein